MIDARLDQQGMKLSSLGSVRLSVLGQGIEATAEIGGEVWECGSWRGGTALWMKARLAGRTLRLFDTFAGLPHSGQHDRHKVGEMKADRAEVEARFARLTDVHIHPGVMPHTFAGLESSVISVAHIDVDQYQSVRDCLEWVYPRVHPGGYVVLDDYGDSACHGAFLATDEFMRGRPEQLVRARDSVGGNPQAHFVKL